MTLQLTQKYEVRKVGETTPLDPNTFFVIRQSDIFAPGGLLAYAGGIQSALELEEVLLRTGVRSAVFTDEERVRLQQLCDDMMDVARVWGESLFDKKVPD